jgi:hypothetical protein
MKKTLSLLLIFVGLGAYAAAQTALTQTTLSAAVSSSTHQIPLTSVTGVSANTSIIFVDGEAMFVNSVNTSSKQASVTRGYFGTLAGGHISLATVLIGPPNAFNSVDPVGSCVAANQPYTPYVNVRNNTQWLCSTVTLGWVPGFGNPAEQKAVTAAVASAAGPVLPSGPLFHVTGALAITAWGSSTTLGAVGAGGGSSNAQGAPFCVIPDGTFTTTATNNIALASTAVVNKILCYTFDGTNKKYIPTY